MTSAVTAPADRPARPAVVRAAAWLMIAGAAAGVGNAIISFVVGGQIIDEFRRRAPGTGADVALINDTVHGMRLGFIGGAVFTLVFAVAVGLLAWPVWQGVRAARSAAWILVALTACCGGLGLVSTFQANPPNLYQLQHNGGDAVERAMNQALADSVPAWSVAVNTTLSILQVLAFGVVVVLLATPAANEFFRKRPLALGSPG